MNDAPTALNDNYSVNEDSTLTVIAPGVLGNDSDVDNDLLLAVVVNGAAHGSLSFNADGSFTYTPNANYNGLDTFTYKPYNGTAFGNVATVTITVNPVNDPPIANIDLYPTPEDTALIVPAASGVLANDTDIDGDPLTAVLVSQPSHGTVTLNADGSFTYTPSANFNGTDIFLYQANDGQLNSAPVPVTIIVSPVNDAPVANNDSYNVLEDGVLNVSAPGVLVNDSDIDSPVITAVLVSNPSHGTLTLNSDGSFTYTPTPLYNGPDTFTYQASDGSLNSATATVNITVKAVNHQPIAINDSYSVNEDATLTVPATGVLANDIDADGDTLTASLVSGPSHGALSLNPDGSFTYTPATNYNGSDSFIYVANDGMTNSASATVNITINPVNDAPVAVNDSYSINEDTTLTVPANGVLANDTDVDGDTLKAVLVATTTNGSLTLNQDGSFTYTPNTNYNGVDTFTYKANDGTVDGNVATVTITVNAINDPPIAVNDVYTINEDTTLTTTAVTGVLANDTDVDSTNLTASVVTNPSHGSLTFSNDGSFIYTPVANYNGTDSFTYQASDSQTNSTTATVTITINPVNDAPVAQNDFYTIAEDTALTITAPGVLGNDTDVDGDPLTASVVTGPSHGALTLNSNGSFTYTPATNYNGPDTFTYKASDASLSSDRRQSLSP